MLPPPSPEHDAIEARLRETVGPLIEAAYREHGKQDRSNRLDAAKARSPNCSPTKSSALWRSKLFKDLEKEIVRGADSARQQPRIDGRDTRTVRPIAAEVGILPRAHGSALFTRGETQALGGGDARHRPGRADDRRARRRVPRKLHAALQLPALFDRRGRDGWARPAGARSVTASSPGGQFGPLLPSKESFPYTIRVVSEITEFERLLVDGLGVRRLAGADGCRRAAAASGRRHRDGADQGARGFRRACPTFSATRTISATWTSRSPAPKRASPRCRWTSRSPRSPRRSCASRWTRRATGASTSSARWPRR